MKIELIEKNKNKLKQFHNKGIFTIEDLLKFVPRRYQDFSSPKLIKDLNDGDVTSVIGTVKEIKEMKRVLKVVIEDEKKHYMELIWFSGGSFIKKILIPNNEYIFCGKVVINYKFGKKKQIISPTFDKDIDKLKRIIPIYSKIKGMSDSYLKRTINEGLKLMSKNEYLEMDIIKEFNLQRSYETVRGLHQPETMKDVENSKNRLIFDELFRFSLILQYENSLVDKSSSINIKTANTVKPFLESLPFELTVDQLETLRKVYKKMSKNEVSHSLIQGDVGCGKTIVALISSLILAENGYQSVILAPTNVLAHQHFLDAKSRLEPFGIKVGFLNGKMKKKEKEETLNKIKSGEINVVIGTHSVFSKDVEFYNLGLTTVDEEHRFGVVQRKLLQEKNNNIHHILMSATPIPRSLASTIYGDNMDIFTIKSMPSGRKKVETFIETDINKNYEFIREEIKKGRQGYVVCPLIEESESERMSEVKSVNEVYEELVNYFKKDTNIKITKISGDMKQTNIDKEINDFKDLKYNIIVSTTIIEVGVNVPNASFILIKNAERFGLSQLHQLRGRVGRGLEQSYCILHTEKLDERMNIMTETTDGFKIAEKDLEIRGMGDFIGTKQTGANKSVMLMLSNPHLYNNVKELTKTILSTPERLERYQYILDEYDLEKESYEEDKMFL